VIFVDITFWDRLAEIINEYGGKGKPLFVEGRLHLDTWEDKTTHQKRSRLRVVAESMQLLGVSPSVARADAEGIEHHVSTETLLAFERFLAKTEKKD
jgi:single stranded DNA-binding protein